jgi:hypothetical protein
VFLRQAFSPGLSARDAHAVRAAGYRALALTLGSLGFLVMLPQR